MLGSQILIRSKEDDKENTYVAVSGSGTGIPSTGTDPEVPLEGAVSRLFIESLRKDLLIFILDM